MSGDATDYLRDPVIYPHWMWVAGAAILLLVVGWVAYSLWSWWHSRERTVTDLQSISDARRSRYYEFIDQIAQRNASGELDERGTHLAIAGLMRALGTERSGRDLEVATVAEIRALVPTWPQLAEVLEACEEPSFVGDEQEGADQGRGERPDNPLLAAGWDMAPPPPPHRPSVDGILSLASQAVGA